MGTWYCYGCHKNMGDKDVCPYCGRSRRLYHEKVEKKGTILPEILQALTIKKKEPAEPIFSVEEAFLMGVHPDDELYRKFMELEILSKDYRK